MDKIVLGDDPDVKGGVYVLRIGRYFYFGMTTNFRNRQRQHYGHLRNGRHNNIVLQRAYRKYGEHSMSFEPVVWCGVEDAARIEAELIQTCAGIRECINMRIENGTTFTLSEETRRRISLSHTGKRHTEATKKKLSQLKRGLRHSEETKQKLADLWRGRRHTEESLIKMSEVQRARYQKYPMGEETKKKLSEANLGKLHTDATRKKMGNSRRGRRLSEEHRRKLSVARAGRGQPPHVRAARTHAVLAINPNGMATYFLSAACAAEKIGCTAGAIRLHIGRPAVTKNKLKGYRFFSINKSQICWSIFPTACTHEHYGSTAP